MGWLTDYEHHERLAAEAEAWNVEHHPDCTQERDCPAASHRLTCRRWRRERYPETYAKIDASRPLFKLVELPAADLPVQGEPGP